MIRHSQSKCDSEIVSPPLHHLWPRELRIRRVLRGFCAMIQFSSFDVARAVRWLFRSCNAWLVMVWRPGSLKGFVWFCCSLLRVLPWRIFFPGHVFCGIVWHYVAKITLCSIGVVSAFRHRWTASMLELHSWLARRPSHKTKNNSVMASTQYLESRWTQWLFKHYTHLFSAILRPSVTISAMAAMEWISD